MSLTLRSSSSSSHENERITRARQTTQLERFLSFNENKSSSVENRRRLLQVKIKMNFFGAIINYFSIVIFSSHHQI